MSLGGTLHFEILSIKLSKYAVSGTTTYKVSKKHTRITNAPLEFKLDDGSNSVKDFVSDWRLNRFNTKEMAKKNRILAPTKVIHFYGVPRDMNDRDIVDLFAEYCAPTPNIIFEGIMPLLVCLKTSSLVSYPLI